MAVLSQFASVWLNAVPIPALGLKLDPMSLKVASGLRLGSPLCHPHKCICGEMVEPNGHHGLTCKKQMGRRSRHDQVNDLIKRALVQGKVPAVTEPSGLSRNDGKRPDGLSLITWKLGKCLIWDFTVADTLCKSYINQTVISAGAAADTRENQKISKYSSLAENYLFVPIGVESFGSWGQEGIKLVKSIGKKIMEVTGEKQSTSYLFQRISMAIQRGNASCVLGTVPPSEGLEEIFEFVSADSE